MTEGLAAIDRLLATQTVHGELQARLHVGCDNHSERLLAEHRQLLETHLLPELVDEIYRGLDSDSDSRKTAYQRFDEIVGGRLLRREPVFR